MRYKTMEKINGKRLAFIALCALALFGSVFFAGCNNSSADPAVTASDYEVELYFVNQAYIDGGDASFDRYFEEEKLITAEPEDIYKETLAALAQPPEKNNYTTMLRDTIKINSAVLEADGRTVTVDFSSDGLSGGSNEELFLVEQIVWTLTESFEQVEQVGFTVDGASAETLMGHMDVSVPYGIIETDDGEGGEEDTVMPLYDQQ